MTDAFKQVLLARVYQAAEETPLSPAPKLSALRGAQVYLKREDLQPVHSFKIRGAYNRIAALTGEERLRGVIAASAGNHAQGVALSAAMLGIPATIVMPKTTPLIKIEAVAGHGAEVILEGDSFQEAYACARERMQESGETFIHPFDDPLVIAGQGTIGREILEQLPDVTHIFVPVGGGGLLAGIALYVKQLVPQVTIIGVEPADSNAMELSLRAGERVRLDHVGIFADGVAVKQVGVHTFEAVRRYVDRVITVSTDEICAAIKAVFEDTRSIVEPAGALAAAGLMKTGLPGDARAVAVCSGANMTFERLQQVAERTLIGSGREVLVATAMPERAGALRQFCTAVVGDHAITQFHYRFRRGKTAHVLVGVSVSSPADRGAFLARMDALGYEHIDLSDDEIAKEHLRHMIGGAVSGDQEEHLYQIHFPERPGALGDFLGTLGTRWNISAFHYRNRASDRGNVLIGFQADDRSSLEARLNETGYEWSSLEGVPSVELFLASRA
ncbi:threonine dehydratase [Alkalispirochaeta sphaeroplastigenens]|uniref:L-threonine dehydratase n=1 Tax=Alkalispirochaeta sphaeroplastigenens TaxID=1187066 RepID=A0A2S4JZ51_9SPIO|nr:MULTISPECIES: threonine ammonia-lyase, biosynthetic [Alkalispirochaeta]POR04776.1 threonine dehydratase [Alkalispirochaeta sphaeroplastigenens]